MAFSYLEVYTKGSSISASAVVGQTNLANHVVGVELDARSILGDAFRALVDGENVGRQTVVTGGQTLDDLRDVARTVDIAVGGVGPLFNEVGDGIDHFGIFA